MQLKLNYLFLQHDEKLSKVFYHNIPVEISSCAQKNGEGVENTISVSAQNAILQFVILYLVAKGFALGNETLSDNLVSCINSSPKLK